MRKKQLFVGLLALVLAISSVNALPVLAGTSELVIDKDSYKEEISSALWNNLDGDVYVEDGKLIFPEDSTDTTSLITKTNAKANDKSENVVSAQATVAFTKLPKGESFAFAIGLGSVESMMGEPGNIELSFRNAGGVKASLKVYDLDGNSETLLKDISCGQMGSDIKINAVISKEQEMTLVINGKEVFKDKISVTGEGRVGFLQTGSCGAKVWDVETVAYRYDNPENINATEDFESGSFNTNAWTSQMVIPGYDYMPTGTEIVEMDGNYVFKFVNSGATYLGTKYPYSNFELSFDVPYIQRVHVRDEDENIIVPKSENFAVSIGGEAAKFKGTGYDNASDLIIFHGDSVISSWNTGQSVRAGDMGYPFLSPDCEKGFSVKISVIDSVITVAMKWMDEEAFTDLFEYQVTRETPLGYVHIWTTASVANLAIDNLKIENKDVDPVLLDVEFKDGIIEKPEDFKYEPMERVYKNGGKQEFNWYLLIPAMAVACVIAVVGVLLGHKIKSNKKSRKEGAGREKESV